MSYRHCESGDLLQMATVESRGKEQRSETRKVKEEEKIGVISAHFINTKTFLKC